MNKDNKDEIENTREKNRQLRKKNQYLEQTVEREIVEKEIIYH